MKKKLTIGIITSIFTIPLACFPMFTNADSDLDVDGFEIMPKLSGGQITEVNKAIKEIGGEGGKVRETYNNKADGLKTSEQIASGIMNRDTLMNYLVFIVQFLSQLGILVGACFIMYAGYKYMLSVFSGGKTASSTLKNAIIGVIIVIFSYAIMRILTSIIGLT